MLQTHSLFSMKNFGICLSSFLFIIGSSTALKCYVCNSAFNEECDENPSEKYLVQCSRTTAQPVFQASERDNGKVRSGTRTKRARRDEEFGPLLNTTLFPPPLSDNRYTFCRKMSLTIPEQNNGKAHVKPAHSRVFRSCGWVNESYSALSSACRWGTGEGIQNYLCYCSENGCNDAGKLQNALILSVTLFMTTFIHWMVN